MKAYPLWLCLAAGSALIGPRAAADYATQPDADAAMRASILKQIALAQALPRNLRRQRLLTLAGAAADPHGVRGAALAEALQRDRDPDAAALAVARAMAAPVRGALAASAPLPTAPPQVAAPPPFADPASTLAFSRTVLARDPGNEQARADAVRAALQLHDAVGAQQLASDAVAYDPNDPAAWVAAAGVAQQARQTQTAMLDLQRARELREQQIGSDTGNGMPASDGSAPTVLAPASLDGAIPAPAPDPVQTASLDALPASEPIPDPAPRNADTRLAQTVYTNPFRDQQQSIQSQTPAARAASSDPMTQQIDSNLASLQAEIAPQVAAYVDVTGRTGQEGLSHLGSVSLPIEATFSPDGYGKLRFMARPTYLFAGHNGGSPLQQAQFGTLAFNVTGHTQATLGYAGPGIDNQDAKGVALDADYSFKWIEADIGSTPLGFEETQVVGGVVLSPRITDSIGLRFTGERRAITDSLLSFGGVTDPNTGNHMGGVTRDRGYAQIELATAGQGYWYLGAGGDAIRGENVEHNTEVEAGAGVNYPVWGTRTDQVRLGLNLVYFGYDKNLEYFTLGQGGYFSPQSYFAALVPISYSERLGRLSYLVSGSVGIQSFHSNASPLFPTSAALQSAIEAKAAVTPGLDTSYGSRSTTGVSGSLHGEVQYEVTPNFDVGGAATYEKAGDFEQGEGLVYARYIFDGMP